jgi:1,4-alpha-glucan branching enzyme
MQPASPSPSSDLDRYSAKRQNRPVRFICTASQAKQVALVGDFNNWDPAACPMQRQPDGAWFVQVELHHGYHQYRFLVDGKPMLDPNAQGVARDEHGEKVSLLPVS